ncbi:MAG: thiamine-phosphate pyrophosphorylase [Candidatus Omnitrophota bacterium]|nr:thiamine-phosphate pyrophosphorylase [Candidatus Omnitrophota bacterium]
MPKLNLVNPVYRVVDANINRVKEALRVLEEITRFILNSRSLTAELKNIRHDVDSLIKPSLKNCHFFYARDTKNDVGRNVHAKGELKRANYTEVFAANIQRVKESLRVLEEFTKLKDFRLALKYKELRYKAYELEKKIAGRILSYKR